MSFDVLGLAEVMDEETAARYIALHEAGHAVAGYLLGVEIQSMRMDWTAGKGFTVTRRGADPWTEAVIVMAGHAVVPPPLGTYDHDHVAAAEFVGIDRVDDALLAAQKLLRPHGAVGSLLGAELYDHGYLSGADVLAILDQLLVKPEYVARLVHATTDGN